MKKMEMTKNKIFVNKTVAETEMSAMTECETIVPDSKPDLLKILQIDAEALITSFEVSNGRINVNGAVEYKILYVPESAKGICSLNTVSTFVHTEEIDGLTEDMYCSLDVDTEHIEYNMINSRKLSLHTAVGIKCSIMTKMPIEVPVEIRGENIETKYKMMRGACRTVDKNAEIIIEDSLVVPPGKPAIETVLKTDVSVRNKDIKIIAGKVVVKGEITVCTLYLPVQSENVMSALHCLPFTEILDAEGIREENFNNVGFKVSSGKCTPVPDSDGEIREIECSVRLTVHITSDEIIEMQAVTDAYSTEGNLEVKTGRNMLEETVDSLTTNTTVKGSITPPEGMPQIMHIYNVVAKPYVTSAKAGDGKMFIEGIIDTYILYISAKDDSPVCSFKEEVPFAISTDSPKTEAECDVKAVVETNHISYNLNAAGEIELRVVLMSCLSSHKTTEAELVESVTEKTVSEEKSPSIVLYFVQKNDTLWDIAKRYHTKTTYIEELNELGGGGLKEGQQILIPRS